MENAGEIITHDYQTYIFHCSQRRRLDLGNSFPSLQAFCRDCLMMQCCQVRLGFWQKDIKYPAKRE